MRIFRWIAVFVVAVMWKIPLTRTAQAQLAAEDAADIHAVLHDMQSAWNHHDIKAWHTTQVSSTARPKPDLELVVTTPAVLGRVACEWCGPMLSARLCFISKRTAVRRHLETT